MTENQSDSSPEIALPGLAKLLDLTERRVNQLAKEGVIPRASRGKYALIPAIHGYIKYLRAMAGDGSLSLTDERTRLTRAQAEAEEIRVLALRSDLIHAETAAALWEQVVSSCRSRLLAMPTKLAPQVYEQQSLIDVKEVISRAVNEALTELGRLSLADYRARDPGVRAAADADREPVGGSAPAPEPRKQRRTRAVGDGAGGVPARDDGRDQRPARRSRGAQDQ